MPRQAETPKERLRRQARRAWTFARNAEEWIAAIETTSINDPETVAAVADARKGIIEARRKLAELSGERLS